MGRGYRRPAQEAFVAVGFNLGLIVTWITQIKFREKQIHPRVVRTSDASGQI